MPQPLILFSTGSPWPTYTGYGKRMFNLLKVLSRVYPIDLRVLTREPLDGEQKRALKQYADKLTEIPRRDVSPKDKVCIILRSLITRVPFHVSVVEHSFAAAPALRTLRPTAVDRVFAGHIYWASAICRTAGLHWVIDPTNADVQYWKVYAQERRGIWRWLAKLNAHLTYIYSQQVYANAACILSVCEEDKELMLEVCPSTRVEVIANGTDCSYFVGNRADVVRDQILFTGTSVPRNMHGLRWFVKQIYPAIQAAKPHVKFLIAGNFDQRAQNELANVPGISFTGKLPDLRPAYDQSAVFVNPFSESYGSKLKVAEALAMGICVVSMPSGVRGFPVVDGESVLLACNEEDFAYQVLRVLNDTDLRDRIGRAGRVVAETQLDWKRVIGPHLCEVVKSVMEE